MRLYFQSSRGTSARQPLNLVFDGFMPEVLGVESQLIEEYSSDDNGAWFRGNKKSSSRLLDTAVTPSSSSGSGHTVVFSAKSPFITILEDFLDLHNANLVEIPNRSDGSDDDYDFQSLP